MFSKRKWYSGFAEIDILCSSDVIQQTEGLFLKKILII